MNFFNKHPVIHPWPAVLRNAVYRYRPREVWWWFWLNRLALKPKDKVLEVGCGEGILLDQLRLKYGIFGFGLDASRVAIEKATKDSKNKYVLGEATQLPFADETFEAVLSFDTLEHVDKQEKMISEMARVLKKEGKILIYTINKKQKYTWNWWLDKVGIDVYRQVDHQQKLFVDPHWLKTEVEKRGVSVKTTQYFNSFFSLILDEIIMIFLASIQKFLGWEKTQKFAKMILGVLTLISFGLTPFLWFGELPWRTFKCSNGFLIMGQKA